MDGTLQLGKTERWVIGAVTVGTGHCSALLAKDDMKEQIPGESNIGRSYLLSKVLVPLRRMCCCAFSSAIPVTGQ